MALLSLIYGTKQLVTIAHIEVDVTLAESHETDVDITENPIEDGAMITDHVQVRPSRLVIEGLISDTPIKFLQGIRSLFNDNRSRKTYNELVALQARREPITVVTNLRQYDNMIVKSISVPRNADTGQVLRFSAEFREILIVESSTISVTATDPKFKGKQDVGKTTPKTNTPATNNSGSLLSNLTGLGG